MNNTQRKEIEIIVGKLEEIKEGLDKLQQEEEENAAMEFSEAVSSVDRALDLLSNAVNE